MRTANSTPYGDLRRSGWGQVARRVICVSPARIVRYTPRHARSQEHRFTHPFAAPSRWPGSAFAHRNGDRVPHAAGTGEESKAAATHVRRWRANAHLQVSFQGLSPQLLLRHEHGDHHPHQEGAEEMEADPP